MTNATTVREKMTAFVKSQNTELLVATVFELDERTEVKQTRCGFKYRAFTDDERIARVAILDEIENREGVEFIDALLYELEIV